jgi:hypothetical protein
MATVKFSSDIDIDVGDRDIALQHITQVPACIVNTAGTSKHASGIYPTKIPTNPITGTASLDYRVAEDRGYVKLDILNVNLYKHVKNEEDLISLMAEPDWCKLTDRNFFEKLIHVNRHFDTMLKMPEPINSIPRLAMFLAIIRPAKRHLIGKTWAEVAKTIWDKSADGEYAFKKSHSVGYAHLVVVNINLLSLGRIPSDK